MAPPQRRPKRQDPVYDVSGWGGFLESRSRENGQPPVPLLRGSPSPTPPKPPRADTPQPSEVAPSQLVSADNTSTTYETPAEGPAISQPSQAGDAAAVTEPPSTPVVDQREPARGDASSFYPPAPPACEHTLVDIPHSMHVAPHPLYDILALMTANTLSIVNARNLDLLQRLLDPLAPPYDETTPAEAPRPRPPYRLRDAALMFGVGTGAPAPTEPHRLLAAAWHRESLTLAVGGSHVILIFAARQLDRSLKHHPFECRRVIPVSWPCTSVLWLADALLTKSAPAKATLGPPPPPPRRSTLPTSLFFVWNCQFRRYTTPSHVVGGPPAATSAEKLTQFVRSANPAIRLHWDPDDAPLAEFVGCSDAPLFCWRALTGFNARPIPAYPPPVVMPKQLAGDRDQITVQVRRIAPHPGGRFLAALYGISMRSAKATPDFEPPLVPSPVVRLWSLRPSFGVNGHTVLESVESTHVRSSPALTPQKKRRFLSLSPKSGLAGKGRSCFLSGVSGLLHFGKSRQKAAADRQRMSPLLEGVPSPDGELQGPEWQIMDQLHRMSSESLAWFSEAPPQFPTTVVGHKRALMALLASRGLLSDGDVAALALGTTLTRVTPEAIQAVKQKMSSRFAEPIPEGNGPNIAAIPAVLDGPYYCCSLNHRAPVLELSWRDDGPAMDDVFVPSVLCTLTVDNCVTIWIESPSDTYLWFEAVILLRLEVSPMRNFFHAMDIVPRRARSQSAAAEYEGDRRKPGIVSTAASLGGPSFQVLSQSGLSTAPFDDTSVTFCWLTAHHVPPKNAFVGNILRLMKSEAKSKLVALEVFEGGDDITPASYPLGPTLLAGGGGAATRSASDTRASVAAHAATTGVDAGILPFRNCGHLGDPSHTILPGAARPTGAGLYPALLDPTPALPSQPMPILTALSHRQHAVDFLLVAESQRGTPTGTLLLANPFPGLWVYTLRELGSQPRGNPAVKRLLRPQQLPVPCKIRTLVSAESVRSLGLSDAIWGDGCVTAVGEPTTVRDGIVLPSCVIVAILESGELASVLVRPRVLHPAEMASSADGERRGPTEGIVIVYETRVEKRLGPFAPPFHVLKTARQRPSLSIDETLQKLPSAPPQPPAPTRSFTPRSFDRSGGRNHAEANISAAADGLRSGQLWKQRQSTTLEGHEDTRERPSGDTPPPSCQMRTPYWTLLEEHPTLPGQLLALSNRGLLFVATVTDTAGTERDCSSMFGASGIPLTPMASLVEAEESASVSSGVLSGGALEYSSISRIGAGILSMEDAASRTHSVPTAGRNSVTAHHNPLGLEPPHAKAIPESSLCCLHALGGSWLDTGVCAGGLETLVDNPSGVALLTPPQRTGESPPPPPPPPLPAIRHAVWLPLESRPPLLLAVTESRGDLLCLEVSHCPGTPTTVRGVPFIGSYCGSVLDVQHLLITGGAGADTSTERGGGGTPPVLGGLINRPDHKAIVSCTETARRSEDDCFILLRVTLEAPESSDAGSVLREEHVILLECREEEQRPQEGGRTALHLELLYEGFMDFSPRYIGLSPTAPHEVAPQLSLVSTPTEKGVLGMMASYPPLDVSDSTGPLRKCVPPSIPHHATVSIYEILDTRELRVCGWAHVLVQRRFGDQTSDTPIVALALCEEWLAVLTATAELHLFSLLNAPPIPALSSLPRMFRCTAATLGLEAGTAPEALVPVLPLVETFTFRSTVDTLHSEALARMRRAAQHVRDTLKPFQEGEGYLSGVVFGEDDGHVKYFKATNSLFDTTKLQLAEARGARTSDVSAGASSRLLPQRRPPKTPPLAAHRLGYPSPLAFRRSRGDGLCLLTTLRCKRDETMNDTNPRYLLTTDATAMELPPHVASLLLVRVRREGVESWWTPNQPIILGNPDVLVPTAAWSSRVEKLLVSTSAVSRCLVDASLPPVLYRMPLALRGLMRVVSAPRPAYHPASLADLAMRTDDLSLVLKVLKRLLEALVLWRRSGRPLPPTIDLPVAFLSAKPVEWVKPEARTSVLRTQLLEMIQHSTGKRERRRSRVSSSFWMAPSSPTAPRAATPRSPQTAAALFEKEEVSFGDFDLESETSVGTKKPPSSAMRRDESLTAPYFAEATTPLLRQETASIIELKSFRETFGELEYADIAEAAPLPEANRADIEELISLLDVELPENMAWLCAHAVLCPHLSISESAQLCGFAKMVLDLLDAYVSARSAASSAAAAATATTTTAAMGGGGGGGGPSISGGPITPLLAAVWSGGKETADLAGSKFLLAYRHTLAATESHIALTRAVAAQLASPETGPDWPALFPAGLTSIASLAGEPGILEPLPPAGLGAEQLLHPGAQYARFSLTTCDLCWAVHCESDDVLLQQVLQLWRAAASRDPAGTPARLSWPVLRQAGVGFWLRNPTVASKLASEDLPRDTYAAQPADAKNPDTVALWYVLTGRVAVLRALYKTLKTERVVEFLSRDFNDEKAKMAANKNAYALVRQRRYDLAVSFFLLCGSYNEAIDLCCGQMDDPQLALFIAGLLEHQATTRALEGEQKRKAATGLRTFVLAKKILPVAIRANDRWLASLILWLLGRYDEAVVATLPPELRLPHTPLPSLEGFESAEESPAAGAADTAESILPSASQQRSATPGAGNMTFGSGSIRYCSPNPSLAALRRHLLGTVQVRRALQDPTIGPELFHVAQTALSHSDASGPGFEPPRPVIIAALAVLCEELINLVDLGESLLYCLAHRFPFQGLQLLNDFKVLTASFFTEADAAAGGVGDIRLRWVCGVSFVRHVCDALGYLTAVNLKKTETDVEWMDEVLRDTVETFFHEGRRVNPHMASATWRFIVGAHGCEHFHRGESLSQWILRQLESPVEFRIFTVGFPRLENDTTADHVETHPHTHLARQHAKQRIIDAFTEALRGLPAWSFLSEQQAWTERVIFNGVATATLGVVAVLDALLQRTRDVVTVQTMAAKALALQTATRVSIAWSVRPAAEPLRYRPLLSVALTACCCIAAAGACLIETEAIHAASPAAEAPLSGGPTAGAQEEHPEEQQQQRLLFWERWPVTIEAPYVWSALNLLVRHIDHLEVVYSEIASATAADEHVMDQLLSELVSFNEFLLNGVLIPRSDYIAKVEENLGQQQPPTTASPPPRPSTVMGSRTGTPVAPSARQQSLVGSTLMVGSEALAQFLRIKGETAKALVMEALHGSEKHRATMRWLLFGAMLGSISARLVNSMLIALDASDWLLKSMGQERHVCTPTARYILGCVRHLASQFRTYVHGETASRYYQFLVSAAAVQFPTFPMALGSPAAFAEDDHELSEMDHLFTEFAAAAGCDTRRGFRPLWSCLGCSRKIQLLMARGAPGAVPSALAAGVLAPDFLPLASKMIACVKDAPISIALDRSGGLTQVHCIAFVGPPSFLSGLPLGLNLVHANGQPGLGILSLSTSQSVWEINVAHSVLFNKHYGSIGGGGAAMLIDARLEPAGQQQPAGGIPVHDDDGAVPTTNAAAGRMRCYDVVAEHYERHIADQVVCLFLSRGTLQRPAPHPRAPTDRSPPPVPSQQVTKRVSGPPRKHNGYHIPVRLRFHAPRLHRHHHVSAAVAASIEEPILPCFNTVVEMLLRGFLNPLADVAVTRLETVVGRTSGGAASSSDARIELLGEETPLVASGLALLPLPHHPTAPPPGGGGAAHAHCSATGAPEETSLKTTATTAERSAHAWLRLVVSLQQRLSRSLLVELQLSCFPPLVPSSNDPHGARTMTLLQPHPFLPVCAGVVADTQVLHTAQASLVISLWKIGEPHIKAIGTLGLWPPPTSQPHHHHRTGTAASSGGQPTSPTPNRPASAIDGAPTPPKGQSGQSSGGQPKPNTASAQVRGGATSGLSPGASGVPMCPTPTEAGLTHAEAGPMKEIAWNAAGDRLIAAHNRGWVSIWALRTDRSTRPVQSSALTRPGNRALHLGSTGGAAGATASPMNGDADASTASAPVSTGLPIAVFKPHTTSCRFATFLGSCPAADTLLMTSGRGLSPTPLAYGGNGTSAVASCAPEEGSVCIWDLSGGDRLGPPMLLMADLKFERGNYATNCAVWHARQCVLYCTRRGEVRLMSLRHPGHVSTVVNPVAANAARARKPAAGAGGAPRSGIETESTTSAGPGEPSPTPTAGVFGREIVKMFLLEESQRIVTCYEDAMIRVWDVSWLCSTEFAHTGRLALSAAARVGPRGRSEEDPFFRKEKLECAPLLWETPTPVHGHDTSKLSLAASLMGAVFNIAPSGVSPRCLLDAQMATPHHVVSLGADGTVILTRI